MAEQLIQVDAVQSHGVQRPGWQQLSGLTSLVPLFTEVPSERLHGKVDVQPVLLCAAPGTGKTWAAQQLANALSIELQCESSPPQLSPPVPASTTPLANGSAVRLVPLLLYVQRLARILRANRGAAAKDFLRIYLEDEYAGEGQRVETLLMAYELRALILIVDGIDEAAGLLAEVEAFILQVAEGAIG